MKRIERAAVLGAGTMGARIAAHFANAGIPCLLLDIVPAGASASERNKVAAAALQSLQKSKPAAFFDPSLARLITIGNFEDDLPRLAESDWIVEAVVENLQIKRDLLKRVEAVRRPGSIVTTNTSGLPVASLAEGFSEDFRRNWFGTHFFNPPRYMRLLEIIPAPDSDKAAMQAVEHLCDVRLGKGIVYAKDTPNFIANRIGTFSVMNVMRVMQQLDLTIEEVDALTGSAVGWPKSATFRTIDMVGLDILGHVVGNMATSVKDERSDLELPSFYRQMLDRKWLGDKTQGGFYKKQKGTGGDERLALDWKTLEYHPRGKPKFPALEMAKNIETTPERLRMLLGLDGSPQKSDKAGQFLWTILSELWTYAANRIPEISDSIVEIDAAMRLGFNWELGPFELWDAAGVEPTVARMRAEGRPTALNVEKLLASGQRTWYLDSPAAQSGRTYFDLIPKDSAASSYQRTREVGLGFSPAASPGSNAVLAAEVTELYHEVPARPGTWHVSIAKKSHGVVKKNAGASLIDLGDGVGCIEFHTKMNALGGDIIQLVSSALKPGGPGESFEAFVITNDAPNFSAGANIMLLLMAAQEEEWDEIDLMIRQFQAMTNAIKFSPKPVVVAPFGMTLGGGCEVVLHAAACQPHAELYMGLVEAGVGLIPAGGGCREMTLRAAETATSIRPGERGESVELMEAMKKAFETIALAKVSTSAVEARKLGLLNPRDPITMNRDRLLCDAKGRAMELARGGYQPPAPRTDVPAPGENILATLKLGVHIMRQGEFITDHEVKIANKLAEVLCGGAVSPGTPVSEQYLLDLEREAFKSLVGERKTQERIQYTLKTGKPLRN